MQRLGLAYHFEDEIKETITWVYEDEHTSNDLYLTALRLRVLREHGFPVSSDAFDRIKGQDGRCLKSLGSDVEGLLSLHEASHLGMPGEDVLHEARSFTTKKLKHCLFEGMESYLADQVRQYWKFPCLGSCRGLKLGTSLIFYQLNTTKSPTLLELAKLDYNLVQSVCQQELKELTSWWRELGFKENLEFARDWLMENFLWAMRVIFEPNFYKCRIRLTKFVCMLTTIDDIYDVYGLLGEFRMFHKQSIEARMRWDVEAIKDLPLYMKICDLSLINFGNDVFYGVLKVHGLDISSYMKEEDERKRGDVVKAIQCYMVEKGMSEEEATNHIKELTSYSRKMMNKEINSRNISLPNPLVKMCLNMGRTAQCIFQHGDGIGTSVGLTRILYRR